MLKKYTTSKLHKYNSIVYTVEPVRTNLKLNKKVRNEYYIEVLIYLTFICILKYKVGKKGDKHEKFSQAAVSWINRIWQRNQQHNRYRSISDL